MTGDSQDSGRDGPSPPTPGADRAVRRHRRHAAPPTHRAADPRRPALVAFALLGAGLAVVLVATTPWETLPRPDAGREAADARRDYSAAEIAREDDYHRLLWPAVFGSMAAALAAALILGFTSLGARLIALVARPFGGRRGGQLLLGTAAVTAATTLASLPFAIWREQIQRDAGLVVRSWGAFASDTATQYGLTAGATLIGMGVLFLLVRLFPRRWWAPGAVVGAALVVVSSFAYPFVVEPAFNDFRSMPASPLRTELLALAEADGVDVEDVLVADASKRTSRVNAYVSGIGSSRRIVIYDTTLAQLSPAQIRTIISHELGHVDHADVLRGTAEGALGLAASVCLMFVVLSSPGVRRRAGLLPPGALDGRGRRADTDPRSVALVLGLVAALLAAAAPVELLVSRRVEARADVHALDLTRDPLTMAQMQRRISLNNLGDLNPNPWVRAFRMTHPANPERIALARTWARLHGFPEPPDMAQAAAAGLAPTPMPTPGSTPTPTPSPAPTLTPAPTPTPTRTPSVRPTSTAKATAKAKATPTASDR